ncbi:MAG: DUF6036 family nucleotidyltransferase [Candidatus Desulfofervidaceae bacterium]|nr:DUF6036 family nucleotidyltransferase [Candidatus Desulfofervidaceae bacterium]
MGGIGSFLARLGFHVVSEVMVNLHPDYLERLEKCFELEKIVVYTLNPYDFAITKISRGWEKDIDDLFKSDVLNKIDLNKLKKFYFEAMDYWIGDKKNFILNWELFEERYKNERSQTKVPEQTVESSFHP